MDPKGEWHLEKKSGTWICCSHQCVPGVYTEDISFPHTSVSCHKYRETKMKICSIGPGCRHANTTCHGVVRAVTEKCFMAASPLRGWTPKDCRTVSWGAQVMPWNTTAPYKIPSNRAAVQRVSLSAVKELKFKLHQYHTACLTTKAPALLSMTMSLSLSAEKNWF